MMPTIHFLQSDHITAFLVALLIFLITIFLVVKKWIGFSMAFLLLLFSLAAGLLVNQQHTIRHYFYPSGLVNHKTSSDDFQQQMVQAVQNLQTEMATEKDNLLQVMDQMQEVFQSVDAQKQKLQNFIEETRERFKTTSSSQSSEVNKEEGNDTHIQTL